ncbi:MAG: acyltransferase family protein [Pirellulaceae bacterium]
MTAVFGESKRVHYLDNLRALAMLLGLYLHGALAYAEPSRSIWLASNPNGSIAIDASIWWIHLFRMSVFYLLSGYFAKLVIERKGLKKFIHNRAIRVALPFILFYPVLMIAMTIMIVFAVAYVKEPEGLLQLIVSASRNPESAGSSPWSTMHLWFLYYLLMFSLIAVVVCHWKWLKLDGLFRRTWLLVLTPLALVPGVIGGGAPVAAPESFIPTWWPFLFYGLFYFAGWQLVGREELLDRIQTGFWPLVILGAVLYVPYYQLLPVLDVNLIQQGKYPLTGALYLVECVLTAYLSATWTIIALLAGQRFLSASNPWLKFFADSSYWVYLIHLPVIIFLQTLLIPAEIPVWGKLLFVLVASWLFCSATYVVFVRYTPVGWMLNGKRAFP